jgi:hypothetical protein
MAYRASPPTADPPAALEWRLRSEKPLAFSVRVDPPHRARSAAMRALVVVVVVGGVTWLNVTTGYGRASVPDAPHSLSSGGAVLWWALSTLGPVLLYQVVARIARRLHVELDSQYFRASVAPLPSARTAALEATSTIEGFDVELRDDGFYLVMRLCASTTRRWAVRFDRRAHALLLAQRLNTELAALRSRAVESVRVLSDHANLPSREPCRTK